MSTWKLANTDNLGEELTMQDLEAWVEGTPWKVSDTLLGILNGTISANYIAVCINRFKERSKTDG